MNLARIRKAIAAFIIPLLGLPIADWARGSEVFDTNTLVSALVTAAVAAIGVYMAPNSPEPPAEPAVIVPPEV